MKLQAVTCVSISNRLFLSFLYFLKNKSEHSFIVDVAE